MLPPWAAELVATYESGAASQFLLHGNVEDRLLVPRAGGMGGQQGHDLGTLTDFLLRVLLPRFDVVLVYDLGNGLRVERGMPRFQEWPRTARQDPALPRGPREAVELISQYLRYLSNLAQLSAGRSAAGPALQVAVIVRGADLVVPAAMGTGSIEVSSMACQMRDWAAEGLLAGHAVATFLVAANRNDLHPLVAMNPRAAQVKVPLPAPEDLAAVLGVLAPLHPGVVAADAIATTAGMLAGTTLHAVEAMLRLRAHKREPLDAGALVAVKKQLVESECGGLIDFIDAKRTLEDVHGQPALRTWLRQDMALWRQGDIQAMPMGYLLCGPVGTGKTYLVECLAGEAGVPVVRIKNFRDKWVGSTEGNLEKIFRLVHALGRAIVFIDEADQALGRRDAGGNDGGIGGRIYAMMAEEMSRPQNRGRILWVLASSRPDLVEVDLKRPGRVDVKIPIFPTTTPAEGLALLAALCRRRGLDLGDGAGLLEVVPDLLTPGAAEALAVKAYRLARTAGLAPLPAVQAALTGYQPPVAPRIIERQIHLAVAEATDAAFVPERFRALRDQPI
jgi:hypothetical protein